MEDLFDPNAIEAIAAILSLIVVAVTVPYIAIQTSIIAEGARSATFIHYRDQASRLNDLFIDNADLRAYFYDGEKLQTDDPILRNRVEALAEAVLDILEAIVLHKRFFARARTKDTFEEYVDGFKEYACTLFQPDSILTQHLVVRSTWYLKEVHDLAEWACAKHIAAHNHSVVAS